MKQIIIIVITLFYALIQLDAQNLDRLAIRTMGSENSFLAVLTFKNELQPFKQKPRIQ